MSSELLDTQDPATQPTFTVGNRAKRAIWNTVYAFLFRPSPRPLHGWRSFLLRQFGAKLGKGVHVYPKAVIWAPWNLEIGDYSGVGDGAICYSMGKITIGKRVVISQGAHICAGTHDYQDPTFRLLMKPIEVHDQAWICAEAFVGPGVTIGAGAVLGARGVAFKDIPAWTVWAGNPCSFVKERVKHPEPG